LNSSTSLPVSRSPLGGMRTSLSMEVMRLISSLWSLLPGTTAFFFRMSARVSSENEFLYLPLVWHSPQRALMIGAMSCAKSIDLGDPAQIGPLTVSHAQRN